MHKAKKARNKIGNVIGTQLGISDKNDTPLCLGDTIRYGEYQGILLYNDYFEEYGIFFGMWYGDDKYDRNSYGKFISVPMDNGARMTIEKVSD